MNSDFLRIPGQPQGPVIRACVTEEHGPYKTNMGLTRYAVKKGDCIKRPE